MHMRPLDFTFAFNDRRLFHVQDGKDGEDSNRTEMEQVRFVDEQVLFDGLNCVGRKLIESCVCI